MKAYILNFNGRVSKSSKKNFQLIRENKRNLILNLLGSFYKFIIFIFNEFSQVFNYIKKANEIILQFGKINDDTYIMDFQYPLSIFQAFAICISSLANKKICE
jgi:tubby-related protein 1